MSAFLPYHHKAKPFLQCLLFVSIYVQFRSSGCWQIRMCPSFPALYHWRLMLILYGYFGSLVATLRGRERWFAEAESLWQMGCLFSVPDITPKSGQKAADYLWWMKMVCTTVAVVASHGPSVITWMLRFALYKIRIYIYSAQRSFWLYLFSQSNLNAKPSIHSVNTLCVLGISASGVC